MLKGKVSRDVELKVVAPWEHRGDITISEGCQFIKFTDNDDYEVVTVAQVDGELNYRFTHDLLSTLDIDDTCVKFYIGFQEGRDDYYDLAVGYISFYGTQNYDFEYLSIEDVTQRLIDFGILEIVK